jgi:hypothetical protein
MIQECFFRGKYLLFSAKPTLKKLNKRTEDEDKRDNGSGG